MAWCGEKERATIRPEFDRSIMVDFQGAKITSDTGFLLLREMDERFGILGPIDSELEDTRSWVHGNHSQLHMVCQRVYQKAAGYEDCNDADFLSIDPALRLATGKDDEAGAGQSPLSRLEDEVLGTDAGLTALEIASGLLGETVRRRVHLIFVSAFLLLTAVPVIYRAEGLSSPVPLVLAALLTVVVTITYRLWPATGSFFAVLALGCLFFPLMFLINPKIGTALESAHIKGPYGWDLFDAARVPKGFVTLEGAGHNDTYLVGGEAHFAKLGEFISRVSSPGPRHHSNGHEQ